MSTNMKSANDKQDKMQSYKYRFPDNDPDRVRCVIQTKEPGFDADSLKCEHGDIYKLPSELPQGEKPLGGQLLVRLRTRDGDHFKPKSKWGMCVLFPDQPDSQDDDSVYVRVISLEETAWRKLKTRKITYEYRGYVACDLPDIKTSILMLPVYMDSTKQNNETTVEADEAGEDQEHTYTYQMEEVGGVTLRDACYIIVPPGGIKRERLNCESVHIDDLPQQLEADEKPSGYAVRLINQDGKNSTLNFKPGEALRRPQNTSKQNRKPTRPQSDSQTRQDSKKPERMTLSKATDILKDRLSLKDVAKLAKAMGHPADKVVGVDVETIVSKLLLKLQTSRPSVVDKIQLLTDALYNIDLNDIADEILTDSGAPLPAAFALIEADSTGGSLKGWKRIGRELGLNDGELTEVEQDYHRSVKECLHQMLLLWQRHAGREATVNQLVAALKSTDHVALAESIVSKNTSRRPKTARSYSSPDSDLTIPAI